MSKIIKYLFLFSLIFIGIGQVEGQISPEEARQELERRGIDDDELTRRLLDRGVDVNKIDPKNLTEVARAEVIINEVIAEMEAEKKAGTIIGGAQESEAIIDEQAKQIAKKSEEISESVEEGASLKEAISEELSDIQEQAKPPAKIYGQEIFRDQSIKLYRQSEDVKPPDSYVLGVGDVIGVQIWGYVEENLNFELSKDGYIKPTGIPRIYLKGISFGSAKKILLSRFQKYYRFRPQEFEVTLNSARTINVRISGEVFNYGSFNMPAINTAFNALVAAGGPNDIGSVRKIKLYRGGQTRYLDVYKYLINPSVQDEFYLQENDIIHVPVAEKIVAIQGAIKRPFRYELLEAENLKDLIDIAGGLKENAFKNSIQIKRYINDKESIIDVALNDLLLGDRDFELFNGDVISINTIPAPYQNFVTISGPVEIPGEYAIGKNNNKLSSVLRKAILKPDAFLNLAYVIRLNDDKKTVKYIPVNLNTVLNNSDYDVILEAKDLIKIQSSTMFVDQAQIEISGAVRNPTSFDYDQSRRMQLSDAIFLGGGLNIEASDVAYVLRQDSLFDNGTKYIRVDLNKILDDPNSPDNLKLEPNDRIRIYPKSYFLDALEVSVIGEVRSPGKYEFNPGLTLSDVVTLSGGLKISASKNKIDIFRVELDEGSAVRVLAATVQIEDDLNGESEAFYLEPFDQIVIRSIPDFEFQQMVDINGEIAYPGTYALVGDNERISDLIERSGGLSQEAFLKGATLYRSDDNVGFIVLDLDKALANSGRELDMILKAGDIINIPKRNNIVTITGAVNLKEVYTDEIAATRKIAAPYFEGKSAKFYVENYGGGVADYGNGSDIYVIQADGAIQKTKKFLFFKNYPEVEPGSTIVVGRKAIKEKKADAGDNKEKTDWGAVVGNSIAQATSVLSLILLLQKLD